jgi:hypothetical protein
VICPAGQTVDLFGKASGATSQTGVNFQVAKQFSCDDGSGEFYVKLQVRIDRKGDNFNWVILGGTGAYEDLHGGGNGTGIYLGGDPEVVLDLYKGTAHLG